MLDQKDMEIIPVKLFIAQEIQKKNCPALHLELFWVRLVVMFSR